MNPKARGEKGQRIVIGELAKLGVDVAIPLTDNLPWDLIVIWNNKLFKAQVKSSGRSSKGCKGSVQFKLTTSNWYKGTEKKYSEDEIDVMFLCDYDSVYIIRPSDWLGRRSFSIRAAESRNKQSKRCNMHDDFVMSEKRIKNVFG